MTHHLVVNHDPNPERSTFCDDCSREFIPTTELDGLCPPCAQNALQTPSGILNAAALYVARYGFHFPTHARDNYGPASSESPRRASDVGAIAFVIYGTEVPMPNPDGSPEFIRFRAAVNAYVAWLEVNYDEGSEPMDSLGLATAFCKAAHAWDTRQAGGVA